MPYDNDPEGGLTEFARLWLAETPDDLHQVLALCVPMQSRSEDGFEPFQLFSKHHRSSSTDALVTAMLLLTDRRWRKGAGRLGRHIEESDILTSDELDLLADAFVRADEAVYWEIPDHWFGEDDIVIDTALGEPQPDDAGEAMPADDEPVLAKRDVYPPLRRWACARLVRRDPAAWGGLKTRARDIGGRAGSALVSGLIDEVDSLPPAAQRHLVELAVSWPEQGVRLLGFNRMAEQDGPRTAHDRAIHDRSARIRSWAATIMEPGSRGSRPQRTADAPGGGVGQGSRGLRRAEPEEQPRLF